MERASRFIWHLKCGKKEQKLFLEAMMTIAELFERSTESLQLFTDGEKRYSQLLFDICHEVWKTGKRGRPSKLLPKGLVIRLKNKSSKRRDAEGKLKKVETPKPEHPEITEKLEEKERLRQQMEDLREQIRDLERDQWQLISQMTGDLTISNEEAE
ncbi:MAG: hypothetical protein ACKO2V_08500, partial [Snowella sp.]